MCIKRLHCTYLHFYLNIYIFFCIYLFLLCILFFVYWKQIIVPIILNIHTSDTSHLPVDIFWVFLLSNTNLSLFSKKTTNLLLNTFYPVDIINFTCQPEWLFYWLEPNSGDKEKLKKIYWLLLLSVLPLFSLNQHCYFSCIITVLSLVAYYKSKSYSVICLVSLPDWIIRKVSGGWVRGTTQLLMIKQQTALA